MHHFSYQQGTLCAEQVPLTAIAAAVGTPFYCYSTATLVRHYRAMVECLQPMPSLVCYALKACSNQAVIKTMAALGAGMDIVSLGELRRAQLAGVPGDKIVFSGVGKTAEEIVAALDANILAFNVESEAELQQISALAASRGQVANINVRVNPDVDGQTLAKINTGHGESKFGIALSRAREVYRLAASLPGLQVVGVDVHIGSQITTLQPFAAAFRRLAEFVQLLRADGHNIKLLDIGGGLGVPYRSLHAPYADAQTAPPLPAAYGQMVQETLGNLGCQIVIEPGRTLVANAAVLVSQVIYLKQALHKQFVIIDAAMNDLIRPTLYEAHHEIWPVQEPAANAEEMVADIVGPVCESGDFLAQDRAMPAVQAGDLVALMSAGAYGAVMASNYNTRPLVPEVLVNGDKFAVVRPRQTLEALIGMDQFAPWQ